MEPTCVVGASGCRCFILKNGRLDKFVSRSSDGIFLGYDSHYRAFRVLNRNPAMHVPSTSTMTTTIEQDQVEATVEGEVVSSERHQGTLKLIIRPQESSATSISVRHGRADMSKELLMSMMGEL
jgi:hypothetical protein